MEPAKTENGEPRPQAVVVSYKKVEGHPRITRIAATTAEGGRDVVIFGLSGTVDEEEFSVGPDVRGVGVPKFNLYAFMLRQSLRPLNALQRCVDSLRWRN